MATETHVETVGAEHGGSEGGLPQFEFEHWGGQIVWLLVLFVILYLLFWRVFAPRLRRVIDERAATIAAAVEQARKVQTEAEGQAAAAQAELAEARGKAQRLAADARAKAAGEAAERQAAEDAKLAEKLGEAEARIRATRDAAMAHVGQIASETAGAIIEKLTGKAPAKGEIDTALKGAR